MHILIAPNAFKNAMTATRAAACIYEGLSSSRLAFSATVFPVGDGGDGTGALLVHHLGATYIDTPAKDPFGRKLNARMGWTGDGTAIIELADTCGLRLLKPGELDPLHALTSGAGMQIRFALQQKARRILLCIGGSSTMDLGTGILRELGMRFLDRHGLELDQLPQSLSDLETIDPSGLDAGIRETELILLCDVNNPLLGENGAVAVFGPQKGADEKQIRVMEAAFTKFRDILLRQTGTDLNTFRHGGAAGGVAAGLAACLGAQLVDGTDYFLRLSDFEQALHKADLVITGEGSLDEQTLQGKAPCGVALRAKQKNIPVIGMAGKIPLENLQAMEEVFDILMPIGHAPVDLHRALEQTGANLKRSAKMLGDLLALGTEH